VAKEKKVAEVARLPFDKYTMVEMNRRDLAGAKYNPRILGEEEKKRLRKVLAKHGMVSPPTWNKRTVEKGWPDGSAGAVVGGHQRLSQLDALHGSPDYTLQVAVIDVTEPEEKEINVALNNPSAQGEWDLELLESILADESISVEGAGFDMGDVMRLFGDIPGGSQQNVEELASKLRSFSENYAKISDNDGRDDFYVVLVFRNHKEREEWLVDLKLKDNRYQSPSMVVENLTEKIKAELTAGTAREVKETASAPTGGTPAVD